MRELLGCLLGISPLGEIHAVAIMGTVRTAFSAGLYADVVSVSFDLFTKE